MPGRLVVLAHRHDRTANTVAAAVAGELGHGAVTRLPVEALGLCTWTHRVDDHGRADTVIVAPDGTTVRSSDVACVLARVRHVAAPRFARSSARDRDYATAELEALLASWLFELGVRVVNPVGPGGRVGPVAWAAWRLLAVRSGLLVDAEPRWCRPTGAQDDDLRSVVVADQAATASWASARLRASCVALAHAAGLPLLGLTFVTTDSGNPRLVAVDPMPALGTAAAVTRVRRFLVARVASWDPVYGAVAS